MCVIGVNYLASGLWFVDIEGSAGSQPEVPKLFSLCWYYVLVASFKKNSQLLRLVFFQGGESRNSTIGAKLKSPRVTVRLSTRIGLPISPHRIHQSYTRTFWNTFSSSCYSRTTFTFIDIPPLQRFNLKTDWILTMTRFWRQIVHEDILNIVAKWSQRRL